MHEGSAKTWLPSKGVTLLLKATLPTCVLSRREPSLLQHAPRSSPYDTGAGPHASCKLTQGGRSQTGTRGARNCPAVTSAPPLSGYVCWVYNQNGYNVGRTTANGLWQKSQHISEAEAKPGDT